MKMDICDDILEENDRYAFLLGSALRNKEQDKFLEIYDKVIPKDLSEKELEEIKDRARQLATVSEEEFGHIAARARDYSLAQPSLYAPYDMLDSETTEEISKIECMRGTASVSSVSSLTSDLHPDLYPHMDKPGLSSLYRTSRHYGPRSENEFSVSDASDSGICMNNSKLDSVSDHDEYERPGVFDYIQGCRASSMEPQIDIVTVKNLSEYNERFSPHPSTVATNKANLKHGHITVHNSRLLESSNSDNEVSPESPRSEDSGSAFEESNSRMKFNREIEMVQLRKRSESPDPETQSLLHPDALKCQRKDARKHNNQVYDEAFPVEERSVSSGSQESSTSSGEELQQVVVKNPDSDVDLSYVNVHSRLYDGRDAHFSSTARDFSEEYLDDELEDDDPGRALQRLSDSITNGSSNSYEREVNFRSTHLYGKPRTYGSFGRDREPVDRRVNFGLGGSSSSLSSGVRMEKSVSSKVKQPPFGDPVKLERVGHSNSRLLQGTNMRSMETKNMPDAEIIKPEGKRKKKRKKKEESEEKSDINGNPLEEGRARSLSKQVEPYNKSESSCYTESRFPARTDSFDGSYVLNNNNDTMQSMDQQKFHEKKARKNKKKEQEVKGVIKAEKIPGHRWEDDVDALLNFIEGDKGGNSHGNRKHQVQKNHQRSPQQPLLTGLTPGVIQSTPVPFPEAIQTTPVKQEQYSENGIPEEVTGHSDVATVKFTEEVASVTQSSDESTKASDLQNTGEASILGSKKEGKRKKKGSGSTLSKENSLDSNKENTSSDASSIVDGKEVVVMATDTSGVVVENGGSLLPEDRYIFTDFENQKAKEEEFQTVSSRKKKKQHQNHAKETENVRGMGSNSNSGCGFINGFTSSVFTSGSNGGMENHHRRLSNGAREYVNHFRHRQQSYNNNKYNTQEKRSYTPPPTPTSSVMEDKQPHSRAFSPSAFPALATKGGSSVGPAGGRRNSTGNVIELEVEEIEKEDSDLESCKSAPASKPVAVELLHSDSKTATNVHHLPQPKVSYARVLGGNQLHDGEDLSHHPQDSPELERRHSLGNLPMPPPGQLDAMKQGVARSQELVNGERTLSSGVSSLSCSSKTSSLANSKYSSTENLATATSTATTGGPKEYPPPQNEVTATITINSSSDADFPPICFTSATSSSSHLEFSNVHVAKNISLTDSQRKNKWSQPPPLVNTSSSHSNGNNYSSSSNNGSSDNNVVKQQQQGAATSQSEAGALLQKTTSDTATTTSSSSLSSSSSIKSKHQTSSVTSSVTPASSYLPSSLTTTTASLSTDKLITKHHVPAGCSSDRRKLAPSSTVLQSGSSNIIISGGGVGSSKNVVNKAKTNAQSSSNNTSSTSNPGSKAPTTRKPVTSVTSTSSAKATTFNTNDGVIFLDRKFHEKTKNFEISFGFDLDMAEVDDGSSARSADDPIEEDRCNSSTSSNSDSVAADNTSVPANHVIVADPSQKLQLHYPLPCLVPSQPPNGLVMTPISLTAVPTGIRPLVTDHQGVSIKEETLTGGGKQPLVVVVDTKTPVTTTARDETVVVAEELSDKSSDTASEGWQKQEIVDFPSSSGGGAAPYELPKLPSRDADPNYQRGKFDLEKAVSYIYTEWCNVMQEGDKVRDSVAVYGRDLS